MDKNVATEDRLEILELCARCNQYFDDGLDQDWAGVFTADDTFHGPAGSAEGRQELAAFCQKTIGRFPVALHFTDHHVLDWVSEDLVLHRCILSVQYPSKDGVQIALYRYDDRLMKENGAWKFKSRRVIEPKRAAEKAVGILRDACLREAPASPAFALEEAPLRIATL